MSDLKCMRKYGIVSVLCMVLLTGCSKNTSEATNDYSNHVVPNIIDLEKVMDGYYYSIDRNTGVMYLSYNSYYRHAITVMLNADGTPVTAEQIGIDY